MTNEYSDIQNGWGDSLESYWKHVFVNLVLVVVVVETYTHKHACIALLDKQVACINTYINTDITLIIELSHIIQSLKIITVTFNSCIADKWKCGNTWFIICGNLLPKV